LKLELHAAVTKALREIRGSPDWFEIVRNGGCEQGLRNLLLCHLQRIIPDSIAFSEASINPAKRIDVILRRLSNPATVRCVAEVKFNFTTQKRREIRKRLITEAHSQLSKANAAGNKRYCVYVIATLYVPTDVNSAIADAHDKTRLPEYKKFSRGCIPDHHGWMKQHHLRPRQLVNQEPVILAPIDAKRDGSRAALSVAIIPFRDLERVKIAFEREQA
jgi:hypothetical protein